MRSSLEALRQVAARSRGSGSTGSTERLVTGAAVEQFASGWKRSYYGKGDVIVYRLQPRRHARRPAEPGVRRQRADAHLRRRVLADLHDRRQHRPGRHRLDEELHPARDAELRRRRSARATAASSAPGSSTLYPQAEGVQVSATEIPYARRRTAGIAFAPGRPRARHARVELERAGGTVIEAAVGVRGFRLLRLGGSAFTRLRPRRVHDAARHHQPAAAHVARRRVALHRSGRRVRQRRPPPRRATIVRDVFRRFESGSIQQVIYQIGTRMLEQMPVARRGAPRSEQPHVGYDRGDGATSSASTPTRGRRTAASA